MTKCFLLVKATHPWEVVFQQRRVYDNLWNDLKCSACGRVFGLSADTYHGFAYGKRNDASTPK
jgi:hypothetical protein